MAVPAMMTKRQKASLLIVKLNSSYYELRTKSAEMFTERYSAIVRD